MNAAAVNDRYGGRMTGCFDMFLAFEAVAAVLLLIFGVLG